MFQSKLVRRRRVSAGQQLLSLSSTPALTSGSHGKWSIHVSRKKKNNWLRLRFNCTTFCSYFDSVLSLFQSHSHSAFESAPANLPSNRYKGRGRKAQISLSLSHPLHVRRSIIWNYWNVFHGMAELMFRYCCVIKQLNEYWIEIMNIPLLTCAATCQMEHPESRCLFLSRIHDWECVPSVHSASMCSTWWHPFE